MLLLFTITFKPLALLIARNGRNTLRIRSTLSTENIWALLFFSPVRVNKGIIIGRKIETSDTITTNISRTLNKFLHNAPLCNIKPYAINFKQISIVNTLVKK